MRTVIVEGAGATPGLSRVGAAQGIVRELEGLGLDPAGTLAGVGVDASLFADPNDRIPDATLGRLLQLASERTGCGDLGLRLGRHARLSSLGLVGRLAACAPDVGAALEEISAHLGLNDGVGLAALSVEAPLASLTYAIYEPGIEGSDQRQQLASAVACNVMQDLCGAEWAPTEVLLPCRRPRDTRPFRRFFRAPVHFDCDRAVLVFPCAWLDRPLAHADPARHARLARLAKAIEARTPIDLPARVRRAVRRLLLSGKSPIEAVAGTLSMHRRTLDRRLEACGRSFRELADGVRYEVAQQLLRDTNLPVTRVAAALQYGDASAFQHAFRRWSGTTPGRWRRGPASRVDPLPDRLPVGRNNRASE